tara:strand:+ start:6161 stop:6571 length:411 start_codon:yes stop_codon:yes gene_type:complete
MRTRYGKTGEICKRQNGRMMMTIRPTPTVLDDKDIAMFLGYLCNVQMRFGDYGEKISYQEAKQKIHDWQYNCGAVTPLTKKLIMDYLTSNHYLAQYEECTDMYECYDSENESHKALLEKVHEIFPSFVVKETEVIA